jgi:hypothetical protein
MWESTVNKAFKVKEEIQPLQNSFTDTIRKDVTAYNAAVKSFIDRFHREGPFTTAITIKEAYATLTLFQEVGGIIIITTIIVMTTTTTAAITIKEAYATLTLFQEVVPTVYPHSVPTHDCNVASW